MMSEAHEIKPAASMAAALKTLSHLALDQAEHALETLADQHGDRFVTEALSRMSPIKVAAMLHQRDLSAPSLLNGLLTPGLAVEVLKVAPLFWENVHLEMAAADMALVQDDTCNLMAALILYARDSDTRLAMLEAIAEDDASLYYLYLPFYGWRPEENPDPFFERRDLEFGGPDQLFEKMRFVAPEIATLVVDYITLADIPLKNHILDLWLNALSSVDDNRVMMTVAEIMFRPLKRKTT